MRRLALALLVVGCDHPRAAPLAAPSPPLTTAPAPPLPSATSAPADTWKPPPLVPPLPAAGPRAYVADATGLVEVAAPGGSQVVVPGAITWCSADARGQVVWYEQDRTLYTYDLVDRTAHKVLADDDDDPFTGATPPIIDWGDQQLGGESKVDYDVALRITMTQPPAIGASIGCDGDRTYACYGGAFDPAHPRLNEQLTAQQDAFEHASFLALGYVAAVAARGARGSLWTPPPKPAPAPKRRPKVARSACTAEPSACGRVQAIPGSALWSVIVGNDRGDFYHQHESLWDPANEFFIAVRAGKLERTHAPSQGGSLAGARVSPGGVLLVEGAVFTDQALHFAPRGDTAQSCGWSNGGFRLRGPTDG